MSDDLKYTDIKTEMTLARSEPNTAGHATKYNVIGAVRPQRSDSAGSIVTCAQPTVLGEWVSSVCGRASAPKVAYKCA